MKTQYRNEYGCIDNLSMVRQYFGETQGTILEERRLSNKVIQFVLKRHNRFHKPWVWYAILTGTGWMIWAPHIEHLDAIMSSSSLMVFYKNACKEQLKK